jgi:hypothetical protein
MPQFDIFFYFNSIFFFLVTFVTLYLMMSYVILPQLLKVLKIRKQKLEYLSKIEFILKQRVGILNNIYILSTVKGLSGLVKLLTVKVN